MCGGGFRLGVGKVIAMATSSPRLVPERVGHSSSLFLVIDAVGSKVAEFASVGYLGYTKVGFHSLRNPALIASDER